MVHVSHEAFTQFNLTEVVTVKSFGSPEIRGRCPLTTPTSLSRPTITVLKGGMQGSPQVCTARVDAGAADLQSLVREAQTYMPAHKGELQRLEMGAADEQLCEAVDNDIYD